MAQSVDEYLAQLDAPVREIAIELCNIVRTSSADITEAIKWNVPVYSIKRNLCSVIAHKSHINLQVFNSAHIADSALLSGTGKDMRHAKYATLKEVNRDQVLQIIGQAIALDSAH